MACVKAVAGLASQNTWLYLAWPSLENMIYGIAFFGSALLGKPLLALYAERLYPIDAEIRASATFQRAFLVVSAVWLCGHTLRAVLRLWLLSLPLPLSVYLVLDTVAGWPINISLVAFTAWYPLRQLRRAGYMGVTPAPTVDDGRGRAGGRRERADDGLMDTVERELKLVPADARAAGRAGCR